MHTIKAIKSAVVAKTVADQKQEVEANFYRYCRQHKLANLSQKGVDEAALDFTDSIKDGKNLTIDQIEAFLKKAENVANPEEKAKREAQGRREERAKADAQLQVKDKQLEVAEADKKKLEAENKELKRSLQALSGPRVKIFSNDPKRAREKDVEKVSDSKLERKLPKKL
jgi:hypothetical protein